MEDPYTTSMLINDIRGLAIEQLSCSIVAVFLRALGAITINGVVLSAAGNSRSREVCPFSYAQPTV